MTAGKRLFDVGFALFLGLLFAPLLLGVLLVMWLTEGRPLFYPSERMKTPTQAFTLWKLRSMRPVAGEAAVAGGDMDSRITPMGRFLRASHIDELPQLWNILKGDMSFVGPRPELRRYVEAYPQYYGPVLQSRPGITGLATLVFHGHEEAILAPCRTPEETHAAYVRRCIPRKARLDRLYAANASLCFDVWLGIRSLLKLGRTGDRSRRG